MQKLKNDELNRPALTDYKKQDKLPYVIILDNVRSALNVGSVFRTADAFNTSKIILCGITSTPPHKEISKTALGATESVEWEYFEKTEDAISSLKKMGYRIYAVEQVTNSCMLHNFNASDQAFAIVFGHEMDGVQQSVIDLCDGCIEIPQSGTKHSINISVCAGVVCWEIYRQLK
ncbi:MAG: RNA methyltransferase [Bacteroidota bacterium]